MCAVVVAVEEGGAAAVPVAADELDREADREVEIVASCSGARGSPTAPLANGSNEEEAVSSARRTALAEGAIFPP
jgi:hypothetical protein